MNRYIGDKVIVKFKVQQKNDMMDFFVEAKIMRTTSGGDYIITFLDPIEKKHKTMKVEESQIE